MQQGELPCFGVLQGEMLHFGLTLLPLHQLSSCQGLCLSHRGAPHPTDVTPAPQCRRWGDPCLPPYPWLDMQGDHGPANLLLPILFPDIK